eukprot:TRINITY_DN6863_c0_g1_i2.p3 TRINITY_DN6863_c0_g1~~TRINITY_DN6863_c0_g1_i2.p3  ORF type:complete len:112 (+),score=16.69 TRINITY_DN6863_c0_g1_i2:154-489(+)
MGNKPASAAAPPEFPTSTQTPLATLGIVEKIYNQLTQECGPWACWRTRFRLTCKDWSELDSELDEENSKSSFLRRFPFYQDCFGEVLETGGPRFQLFRLNPESQPQGFETN